MAVSVIVPFRGDDGRRSQVWEWISQRWAAVFPDWELCVADSFEDEFNRSEARNLAFAESDGDVLVIADADSFVTTHTLLTAVEAVEANPDYWFVAHSQYLMLNEDTTDHLLTQPESIQLPDMGWEGLVRPPFRSDAGMLVMSRDAFVAAGGYDQRFKKWGLEDWAFKLAVDTMVSPAQRVNGSLLHFYHGPPKGDDFGASPPKENQELYNRYRSAKADPEAMLEIINEHTHV